MCLILASIWNLLGDVQIDRTSSTTAPHATPSLHHVDSNSQHLALTSNIFCQIQQHHSLIETNKQTSTQPPCSSFSAHHLHLFRVIHHESQQPQPRPNSPLQPPNLQTPNPSPRPHPQLLSPVKAPHHLPLRILPCTSLARPDRIPSPQNRRRHPSMALHHV